MPPLPFICTTPHPFPFPFLKAHKPSISSHLSNNEEEPNNKKTLNWSQLGKLSATMTIISTSIPCPVSAASSAVVKSNPEAAITLEELRRWSEELPSVKGRVGYRELLRLKEEGRLKNVVKSNDAVLRLEAEVVLAVLDDSRVLRTVVPSVEEDPGFWKKWDELGIDGFCMNAYTPQLAGKDEDLDWVFREVERVGRRVFDWAKGLRMMEKVKSGLKNVRVGRDVGEGVVAVDEEESSVAALLRKARKELVSGTAMTESEMRRIAEMERRAVVETKRTEERKRKEQLRKEQYEATYMKTKEAIQWTSDFLTTGFSGEVIANLLAVVFFVVFYQVVVVGYQKKKKDTEERRKIEELERQQREMDEEKDAEEGKGEDEDNPQLKMAQKFMKSGARLMKGGKQRQPKYLEKNVDVKFSDVAGLGKLRLELEEVVKFFTHADMYRRRGIRIPGGILLYGPPGVGKTLLAKAVAGEAGVNFFYVSASQFVEIYEGVGASRVRQLYEEAKENAPSIVFIDELDAVGRKRGLAKHSGGLERDATLNQLLVCLDGFEGRGEVITIACTNRLDILDEALIRPGRFDRKINIPLPSFIGRIEILKVHARKKKMAADVDYEAIANATDGMSGAELANLLEVAGSKTIRAGRTEITTDDLLEAVEIEDFGILDNNQRSPELSRRIALHQASCVAVAVNFPALASIEFVTITPRTESELGHIRKKIFNKLEIKEGLQSRQTLLDNITILLAPRAADEIWHGERQLSTMCAGQTHEARKAARAFVLDGLSEKYDRQNLWTVNDIDPETLRILNLCYDRVKEILHRNKKLVDVMVDELLEKNRLVKKEILELVKLHGSLDPEAVSR